MNGGTIATGNSITPRRRGSWAGERLLGSARGLAFVGLALAEAGLVTALALIVTFAIFVYPLLLIPPTLLAVRRLANVTRRLSGQWCGVPIPVPYRAYAGPGDQGGTWRRFGRVSGRLLTEPATWRDLLWMIVDPLAGCVLAAIPITVIGYGVYGVVMPARRGPVVPQRGRRGEALLPPPRTLPGGVWGPPRGGVHCLA